MPVRRTDTSRTPKVLVTPHTYVPPPRPPRGRRCVVLVFIVYFFYRFLVPSPLAMRVLTSHLTNQRYENLLDGNIYVEACWFIVVEVRNALISPTNITA